MGCRQYITAFLPVPRADLMLPIFSKFFCTPNSSLQIQRISVARRQSAIAGIAPHFQITDSLCHIAVKIDNIPVGIHPTDNILQPSNIHRLTQKKIIQQQQRVLGLYLLQGLCHPLTIGGGIAVYTAELYTVQMKFLCFCIQQNFIRQRHKIACKQGEKWLPQICIGITAVDQQCHTALPICIIHCHFPFLKMWFCVQRAARIAKRFQHSTAGESFVCGASLRSAGMSR